MRKLLLLLLLTTALSAHSQQTFFTPGVPPTSTSFTPSFRFIGTDSLASFFINNASRWSQFYTAAQINNHFAQGLSLQSSGLIGIGGTFNAPMSILGNINVTGNTGAFKVLANVTATANNSSTGIIEAEGTFTPGGFTGGNLYAFLSRSTLPSALGGALGLGGKLYANNYQIQYTFGSPGRTYETHLDSLGSPFMQFYNSHGMYFGDSAPTTLGNFMQVDKPLYLTGVSAASPTSVLGVDGSNKVVKFTPGTTPATYSVSNGYGILSFNYNNTANQQVMADTGGMHGLVSKDRLAAGIYTAIGDINTLNITSPALNWLGYYTPTAIPADPDIRLPFIDHGVSTQVSTLNIDTILSRNVVDNVSQLSSYAGQSNQVFVRDRLQGGTFVRVASGLTIDSAFVFPASGGGYWRRQYQNNGSYPADFWGIKADSTVDNSALIQQAIDFIYRKGGGTLQLHSPGKYIAGNVHIRDNVKIMGDHASIAFHNGVYPNSKHSVVWTLAPGTSYCIGTLAQPSDGTKVAVSTAFVQGITFVGLGYNASSQRGIDMISWRRGMIADCSFINFADEAIYHHKPISGDVNGGVTFRDLWAATTCLDTTTNNSINGGYKACIAIGGNDDNMETCLFSPMTVSSGPFVPTGNGKVVALYVSGSDFKVNHVENQFADVGMVLDSTSTLNTLTDVNFDETSRQSLILRQSSNNTINFMQFSRPAQEANNTYPAISILNNSVRNIFNGGTLSITGGNGNLVNYVVQETLSNSNTYDKNYIGPITASSSTYATDRYNSSGINASWVQGNENQRIDGTATPDVSGYNYIVANTGTTITSLSGGTPGQWVEIHFTVATTVTSGSGITLTSGTFTFAANKNLRLRNYLGTWYEVQDLHATATTSVNGSTSGTALFSEVVTPTSKEVTIYCSALLGTATYTVPNAFLHTPAVVTTDELSSSLVTTKTTTTITITGTTSTGYIFIKGN